MKQTFAVQQIWFYLRKKLTLSDRLEIQPRVGTPGLPAHMCILLLILSHVFAISIS